MRARIRSATLATAAVCLLLWSSAREATTQSSTPAYGVSNMGTLGGSTAAALGIADGAFPYVYGYAATASGDEHAFFGNAFRLTDLGTLGGRRSEARAVSNYQIAGRAQLSSGAYHAVHTNGSTPLHDLGTLGGSESSANGIALVSTGTNTWKFIVVGGAQTAGDAATRAFVYDTSTSTMSDLGATLGGPNTVATGINASQHVVGYADLPGGSHHAFVFANGATQDLGSLGTASEALAINDTDVIVGGSDIGNAAGRHAFRYQNGVIQDLGTLGGSSSEAGAVNTNGTIVGWSDTAQGARHAFVWRNGVMTDLNALIRSGTGWVLQAATAVGTGTSGAEPIVGYGQFQGQTRAFLLTPPLDLSASLTVHRNLQDTNFPNPIEAGQPLPLGLSVSNNTGYVATNVTVTQSVSGPVQIDTVYSRGSCTVNGQQVTCNLGSIDGAGSTVDSMIAVHGTGPGVIMHSGVIVSADQPDPNSANNSGSETNTAVSLASLTLSSSSVVGGQSVLSRATLTSTAPGGGATVKLTSSNPAVARVPSQFDVLQGCCDNGTWREFYVTTTAVSAPVTVQISGTYGLVTITVPLTITPGPTSTPFGGSAWAVPGTIEAENFDDGGEGVAYHDTSAGNNGGAYRPTDVDIEATTDTGGGYDVGWMTAGEWLQYTVNVTQSATYRLTARVAASGAGGTFHIEFGGVDKTGPLTIPNTGGWQAWTDVTATVSLAAGTQTMRIVEDANGPTGVFGNMNYVTVAGGSGASPAASLQLVRGNADSWVAGVPYAVKERPARFFRDEMRKALAARVSPLHPPHGARVVSVVPAFRRAARDLRDAN